MRFRVCIEMDVSKTIAETIKRNGFKLEQDGTGMKVVVPNAAAVTKRKIKVHFDDSPKDDFDSLKQ